MDGFPKEAREHVFHVAQHGVQVQSLSFEHLFATEHEQLPDEFCRAFGRGADLFQRPFRVGARRSAVEQNPGVSLNDGQDVVDVVGDAGGQLADTLHFLGLPKLRLQAQPLRDVLHRDHHSIHVACRIQQRRGVARQQDATAVHRDGKMQILRRLPRIENLLERRRLARRRVSLPIRRKPFQNTARPPGNGFLAQTEHLLGFVIGESDSPRAGGHDDADRAGFGDAADEVAFAAEVSLGLFVLDRVAHRAFQRVRGQLAFDQVIRRAGFHRLQIHSVVALPRQENHRHPATGLTRLSQQVEPRQRAEAIVQQTQVVQTAPNRLQPALKSVHPLQLIPAVADPGNQIAGDDEIVLVIIDQQYFDRAVLHGGFKSRPAEVPPPQTSIFPAP